MMAKKRNQSEDGQQYTVNEKTELLPFLLQVIDRGRNHVKAVLGRGQVLVDNEVQTVFNLELNQGQTVTILKQAVEKQALIGLTIMYEDDAVLVVNKKEGLLSVAAPNESDVTAYRQLTAHVRQKNPKNRIFIVHRLDRDTSGVMVFAKTEEVKLKLQDNWKDVVKERTYIALVEGKVKKEEGTISTWLKESKTHKMHSNNEPNGGQKAITHFKTLSTNARFSLLQVELETGRKNQIRAHMEDFGFPVVGDKKYGAKTNEIGRLGLHAKVLAFTHPTTNEVVRFEADVPKSFFNKSR